MEGWTAYNIRLSSDRYTMGDDRIGASELMAARYLQLVADFAPRPLDKLRILDIGAMEGLYGLEFAMHGAEVVAIEGRTESAEKARFAASELGVDDRYEIRVEDVRDISVARYGTFDVVLCLGILYHLEAQDAFALVHLVRDLSEHLAVFRTAVGLSGRIAAAHDGRTYHGFTYREEPGAWASIGNAGSFWPTRASLLNLLCDAGFTSVTESVAPPVPGIDVLEDLSLLLAVNGEPLQARAVPEQTSAEYRSGRVAEDQRPQRSIAQRRLASQPLVRRLMARRFWQATTRRS